MDAILVMGYSSSTKSVVELLSKEYTVYVSDIKINEIQLNNVVSILQEDIESYLDLFKFVVKSPGIPYHNQFVKKIVEKSIPIYTEIEIAYQKRKDWNYIAITGTNGKTTVTSLTHHILNLATPTIVAGNIGKALCDYSDDSRKQVVLELSNFQLLGIDQFKPHLAVIMNLTPDHLDYMLNVEDYYKSKTLIYKNQTSTDYFLLNVDDEMVLKYCTDIPSNVITFSVLNKADVYYGNNKIYYLNKEIADLKEFKLKGLHNIQNAMIAVIFAHLLGISREIIQKGLASFEGIKHRLQYLKTINGVEYYNDSKATNPEACETALRAFDVENKIILLVGGYDKKVSFDILKQYKYKVKKVYAYGDVKYQFEDIFDCVEIVETLEEATKKAYQFSEKGDIVLLSPACASYDQFKSYEHRGDLFTEYVDKLENYD